MSLMLMGFTMRPEELSEINGRETRTSDLFLHQRRGTGILILWHFLISHIICKHTLLVKYELIF